MYMCIWTEPPRFDFGFWFKDEKLAENCASPATHFNPIQMLFAQRVRLKTSVIALRSKALSEDADTEDSFSRTFLFDNGPLFHLHINNPKLQKKKH